MRLDSHPFRGIVEVYREDAEGRELTIRADAYVRHSYSDTDRGDIDNGLDVELSDLRDEYDRELAFKVSADEIARLYERARDAYHTHQEVLHD